jgi:hypothetical protein
MVFIVQCETWGNAFKFVDIETGYEHRHKMKKDYFQMRFRFFLKDVEVAFKLERYIFKLHLSRF